MMRLKLLFILCLWIPQYVLPQDTACGYNVPTWLIEHYQSMDKSTLKRMAQSLLGLKLTDDMYNKFTSMRPENLQTLIRQGLFGGPPGCNPALKLSPLGPYPKKVQLDIISKELGERFLQVGATLKPRTAQPLIQVIGEQNSHRLATTSKPQAVPPIKRTVIEDGYEVTYISRRHQRDPVHLQRTENGPYLGKPDEGFTFFNRNRENGWSKANAKEAKRASQKATKVEQKLAKKKAAANKRLDRMERLRNEKMIKLSNKRRRKDRKTQPIETIINRGLIFEGPNGKPIHVPVEDVKSEPWIQKMVKRKLNAITRNHRYSERSLSEQTTLILNKFEANRLKKYLGKQTKRS